MTQSREEAEVAPASVRDRLRGGMEIGRVICVAIWTTARFIASDGCRIAPERRSVFAVTLARALGPLYVKLAQILAAQSGMLSGDFRGELQGVFDQNAAMPFSAVRELLEASYGQPLESVFAQVEPQPVGVGSVAQVHAARLASGEAVAVKIVNPAAGRALRHALAAAQILIEIADRFVARLRPLRLTENLGDIRAALLRQTDLVAEREEQERIALLFADDPTIVVPRVHAEFCTPNVLVMDFIAGVPLYRLDASSCDRPALARRMQDAFFAMIYLWGHFHVDPHPGNMLLLPDGRLALLDYGMVGELSEANRQRLRIFNGASVMRLWTQAADYFLEAMVIDASPAVVDLKFRRQVADVIRVHFSERQNRWSTAAFLGDMTPVLRAGDLRLRTDMSLLALSLATAEGVLNLVDPDVDLWGNARRFVEQHA